MTWDMFCNLPLYFVRELQNKTKTLFKLVTILIHLICHDYIGDPDMM